MSSEDEAPKLDDDAEAAAALKYMRGEIALGLRFMDAAESQPELAEVCEKLEDRMVGIFAPEGVDGVHVLARLWVTTMLELRATRKRLS